jgi:hypothetical protein
MSKCWVYTGRGGRSVSDKEKWRSIGISKGIARKRDAAWRRDADAYARLRRDGHQPPHVSGSATLEAEASMPMEIEMGKVFDKKDKDAAKEGWDMSYEIGLRGPSDRNPQ